MYDRHLIFPERLRELRKKRGMKATEVATALGMSRAGYSNWELAVRKPTPEGLEKVAALLNTTPAYLFGWSDEETASRYQAVDRMHITTSEGAISIPNATDDHAYSTDYLTERRFDADSLIAIKVDDDAMKGVVGLGDTVLVNMKRKRSDARDLFAILVNSRVWIRWIRPELDGNTYTLSAEDTNGWPDQPLSREQLAGLDIIGRVSRIERDR